MYLDLLLFINLGMNFFILSLVSRLSRRSVSAWRLFLAALAGSIPVIAVVDQGTGSLSWWLLLFCLPIIMVSLAFYPIKLKELFFLGGGVFLIAFLLGGVIMSVSNIVQLDPEQPGLFPWVLLPAVCVIGYLVVNYFQPYLQDKKWQHLLRASIQISLEGRDQTIEALLDTGNRVKEPFFKKPVIIVDYRGLRGILPPRVFQVIQDSNLDPIEVLGSMEPGIACRFHLIPLVGLGGKREMLLGFRPDNIRVFRGEHSWEVGSRVVLGLYQRNFGPTEEFQALMPPEVMNLV